ncbi:MAG: hypothetical protein IJP91_08090 [Synergistaceae bacterium]|nr:hypothetical protein [Synergistaceae bacterium]
MIDINNLKSCRSHEEAVIEHFMNDPKYAEELLNEVLVDGDDYEKARFQYLYDEAKARSLPEAMSA